MFAATWKSYSPGVPNLWYAYHWWYTKVFQVVRENSLFSQKPGFHIVLVYV